MKNYKKLLTQEQKEELCYLHWEQGTLFEDDMYQHLISNSKNEHLKEIYYKCLKEACEEQEIDYDEYCKGNIEFWDEDYDELLLLHMQKLNEVLGVGLYD